jgi:hypothetical protein
VLLTLASATLASARPVPQAPEAPPPPAQSQAQSAPPAPPASRQPPCSAPVHRQFDFWVGTWDVVNAAGRFAGINRIERTDGGCTLYESWASGAGGYIGRSVNSVGGDGRWRQTWVDSGGLRLDIVGGMVGDSMVMEGDTPGAPGAPPVKNRITWTPLPEGRVRQHWQTSEDSGKTWTDAFDGIYHRIEPVAEEKARAASGAAPKSGGFPRALEGAWIGSGTVQSREAHVELSVARVLGGRFVRLDWRNNGGRDGRQLFEGFALYEERPDGTLAATWWDSQGARHAVSASVEGAALTALWGERGRTVYRLLDTGELEVTDSIKGPAGSFTEFGRTTLKRKSRQEIAPTASTATP